MFSKILKELRKEKGYTQMKLASKLGISRSAVSMWEIGESEPDNAVLCKIAELFDVSIDYLLGIQLDSSKSKTEQDSFDSTEKELIKFYRLLDDEDKAEVRGYINGLLRSNKNIYTKEATG